MNIPPSLITHQGHRWLPESGIERRLKELSAQYPASILLELDAEGRNLLESVLEDSQGEVHWTDGGGGDLTQKHWDIVINHISFVEVALWFANPSDVILVRAACMAVEQMVAIAGPGIPPKEVLH